MLDENLPTFYLKPSSDNPLSSTLFLSQNGSELQPEYTLRRPNPEAPASKNVYAVALYDSYNPEVLFAEVLVRPEWTQPTLSAAEVRAQNGIPPPPIPIVPNTFTIQLYNPDQQVMVRQVAGSWNTSAHWEFEMPQNSFRVPSASALDRSQSDPAVSDITPKISFKWKRDGKLSKDISCYLSGRSTEGKKSKEPDITVAMFKGSKNLTIYEPNMQRVEVEDVKGLEVVLLLGAHVIKDIYFNANRELFNISSPSTTTTNPRRKNSGPIIAGASKPPSSSPVIMSGAVFSSQPLRQHSNVPPSQIPPSQPPRTNRHQHSQSQPPPPDPRIQWEIDAETERLKKIVQQEERERERADREEAKRIQKMLDAEEKERRKRDAEVAKETERLKKQYGVPKLQTPPMPPRPQQQQQQQYMGNQVRPGVFPQHYSAPHSSPAPVQRPLSTGWFHSSSPTPMVNPQQQQQQVGSPYLQTPGTGGSGAASSSGFFGLGGGRKMQKKRSVFF